VDIFTEAPVWALFGSGGPYLCHPTEMALQYTVMNITRQEMRPEFKIVNVACQLSAICGQSHAL